MAMGTSLINSFATPIRVMSRRIPTTAAQVPNTADRTRLPNAPLAQLGRSPIPPALILL